MPKPKFDPQARMAVQTERDPVDRQIECRKAEALEAIVDLLESIDRNIKRLADAQDPPMAQSLNPTVTEIPRT